MYTGTIFNWHDNSAFEVDQPVVDTTNRPLFMTVGAFDKGPEKLMEVDATNFNSLFGTMSYEKYGQASIQAQNIIDAGGRLLVKRVCANDSKLAYSVLVAHLKNDSENALADISWTIEKLTANTANTFSQIKKAAISEFYSVSNEVKIPLFVIADNGRGFSNKAFSIIPDYETSRGVGKMLYRFNIYEGTTLIENANISIDPSFTFNDEYYGLDRTRMTQVIGEVIPEMYEEFIKQICLIVFQSDASYVPTETEKKYVSANVDFVFAKTFYGEQQVKRMVYDPATDTVSLWTDSEEEEPQYPEGKVVYEYEVDATTGEKVGDMLDVSYGNLFKDRGDNGVYGTTPARYGNEKDIITKLSSEEYDTMIKADINSIVADSDVGDNPAAIAQNKADKQAYTQYIRDIASVYLGYDTDGSLIDEVWDTDAHKIFAVADANYDKLIKDCIASFVMFRQDCIFLRDCGIGAYDVDSIIRVYTKGGAVSSAQLLTSITKNRMRTAQEFSAYKLQGSIDSYIARDDQVRSRFIADYGTTYEIIDPISKRNIDVTMIYDLVAKLTNLYINQGPFAPLAGTYNGFQLEAAIPDTVNFTPIITPTVNQKAAIDDARLNYAIFENEDSCVVQSNYTSQQSNTQLSYINNVLAIQEVARVVRTVCPRNRFRLITGSDMSEYANNVSRVLQQYASYFETLEFVYTEDKLRAVQKIFYASINFSFNNWAQTEIFDLYALTNTTQNSVYE